MGTKNKPGVFDCYANADPLDLSGRGLRALASKVTGEADGDRVWEAFSALLAVRDQVAADYEATPEHKRVPSVRFDADDRCGATHGSGVKCWRERGHTRDHHGSGNVWWPRGSDGMFFVATTKHGFVGNATVFWAPESKGYVTDIERAGRYSEEEARDIAESSKGECFAIPCHAVEAEARRYLHGDDMRRLAKEHER